MTLDTMRHFVFEVGKILPKEAWKYITRVVGPPKDGGPQEHRGTAVLCNVDGQQAFVTAEHVLSEMDKEGRFSSAGFACVSGRVLMDVLRAPDIDIAAFIPREPLTVNEEKQFWPAAAADLSDELVLSDYCLVEGFPARFARYSALAEGYVSESYTHCTGIRIRESLARKFAQILPPPPDALAPVPDRLLKPCQIALNYAEATGPLKTADGETVTQRGILHDHAALYQDAPSFKEQKSWGAFGLSGSPVWRFGAAESEWDVSRWSMTLPRLTGIVTEWNEAHQMLVVTPIGEILRKLRAAGIGCRQ